MTSQVDPLEAIIKLARADTALNTATGGRIDVRHNYGQEVGRWALDAASLVIFPSGGVPQIYHSVYQQLYEARCYGNSYQDAWEIFQRLYDLCAANHRRTVTIAAGIALVYFIVIRNMPRQIVDEDVRPNGGMPALQFFLEARVADQLVV